MIRKDDRPTDYAFQFTTPTGASMEEDSMQADGDTVRVQKNVGAQDGQWQFQAKLKSDSLKGDGKL